MEDSKTGKKDFEVDRFVPLSQRLVGWKEGDSIRVSAQAQNDPAAFLTWAKGKGATLLLDIIPHEIKIVSRVTPTKFDRVGGRKYILLRLLHSRIPGYSVFQTAVENLYRSFDKAAGDFARPVIYRRLRPA